MQFFKNNLLKAIIVLVTIMLGILCVYAIVNYGNSNTRKLGQNTQYNDISRTDNVFRQGPDTNFKENNSNGESSRRYMSQTGKSGGPQYNSDNSNFTNNNLNRPADNTNENSSSKYSPAFIAYSILFFILFIAAYLILVYKKIKVNAIDFKFLLSGIFIIGILLRIYSGLLIDGQPFDINIYKRWAAAAANNLFSVYSNQSSIDYPPVYIYVLAVIGKLSSIPIFSKYYYLLLKLPSILADIASAYLIYRISNKHISKELGLILSAFYIFNPAVLINSTIWGQADSFFTFIVIIAVFLLSEKKLIFSSVFFTIAVLTKPQAIILLPLLLFELIRQRNIKSIIQCVLPALITALIIILPFSLYNGNITWIFNLYGNTISEYPYASDNAFNFFTLIGANNVKYTTTMFILNYHSFGLIFIILITIFSGFIYLKSNTKFSAYLAALILIVGVFNFSVGMHERYMFSAVAVCILAYIHFKDRRLLVLSVLFSIIIFINTHVTLFDSFNGINIVPNSPIVLVTSLLNVLCFIYLVIISINNSILNPVGAE